MTPVPIEHNFKVRPYWVFIALGIASCLVFFYDSVMAGFAVAISILVFLEPVVERDYQ